MSIFRKLEISYIPLQCVVRLANPAFAVWTTEHAGPMYVTVYRRMLNVPERDKQMQAFAAVNPPAFNYVLRTSS